MSVLGEGAMGTVYLAEWTAPMQQRVALKIIKLGMDTKQVVARFEVERQALAMMNHPHVARVFDGGATPEGRPYFVMELVKGIPITEYCDKHRLSTVERLKLFAQVCEAVQHAHQKGIIHRDLKPSNVMVTVQDDQSTVKVIDFGVAKATERHLTERTLFTEQGQLIGTPAYMSPEQAEMTGLDIDTRTDIYSLGVLLYELLAGALPFDSEKLREAGLVEIHRIIREEEPPRPSTCLSSLGEASTTVAHQRRADIKQLASQLRGDLDWITMKAMDKDRIRRYATATEFAADLARHVNHEPVGACPPSTAYRFRKFLRRNKGPVAAVSDIIVALAIGLSAAVGMYLKAEKERNKAEQREVEASAARDAESRQRALAEQNMRLADQRYEEIIRLADLKRLADAKAAADGLWPAHPEKIEVMETWLEAQAAPLRDNLPKHEATLVSLRNQALEYDPEQQKHDRETHPRAAELAEQKQRLAELQKELDDARAKESEDAEAKVKKIEELEKSIADSEKAIAELEEAVKEHRTWKFPDDQIQWQHDTLTGLV
ncbi:MAG: protein kinase [Phycisphaerae bacterium]